jgi:hypothetical protein
MKPGDVVTCTSCGATSAPAHTTGGRSFEEGGAVIVSWTNGPWPRHDIAARVQPTRCCWCDDKLVGIPPPSPDRINAAAGQPDPFFGTIRYVMTAPPAADLARGAQNIPKIIPAAPPTTAPRRDQMELF